MSHYGGDLIFLKKADGCDPSRAGFEALACIGWTHAAQGQHRDFCSAGLMEGWQARWLSLREIFLLKNWCEYCETRAIGFGSQDFCRCVAGDSDQRCFWQNAGEGACATLPDLSDFRRRNILGTKMDAVGS